MRFIIAILIFSVIIIFHELGHFLLAKANKIKVNEFCLGMGPKLFGIKKGETEYALRLLPFGGACVMEGEDENIQTEGSFNSKSVWARMSVVAAGPVFNFIMAYVLSAVLIGFSGYDKPQISGVMDGYPAQEAGIQGGDVITKLNHKNIHFSNEINVYLFTHAGENITVQYERDGKKYETTLSPKYDKEKKSYLIGIQYESGKREKTGLIGTIKYAAYEVEYYIWSTVESLKMLISGSVSVNDLSGPVGIVKSMGETYQQSSAYGVFSVVMSMLNFTILLSANLGVMNLLPIPALDGGRLVFLIVEAIRRKRIDQEKEGMVNLIGLAALMLLMVVVMFNDIRKLFI
ncbi:MAG: RIP metalloprotease RseP [Lachnospiraceae bacterium]